MSVTDSAQIVTFRKESAGAARIIKGGLNDDLFKNVEDTNNPKEIWDKLKKACSQVGQEVIYAGLRSLLTHPSKSKTQGHEKSINT